MDVVRREHQGAGIGLGQRASAADRTGQHGERASAHANLDAIHPRLPVAVTFLSCGRAGTAATQQGVLGAQGLNALEEISDTSW